MAPRKGKEYNKVSAQDDGHIDNSTRYTDSNDKTAVSIGLDREQQQVGGGGGDYNGNVVTDAGRKTSPICHNDDGSEVKHLVARQQRPRQQPRHEEDLIRGIDESEDSTDIDDDTLHISVDEAIERLGFGIFQCYVLVAAGFCFAADAMQVLLFSFLSEVLRELWNLTKDEAASMSSVLFAGAMLGTLILGPLADKYGRHPIFLVSSSIIAIFGISVAFVTSYWNLLPVIFMIGCGVGGLTVPFDILAEFLPAASRGKNLLLIEYFWTIGTLYVVVMAYFTLGGRTSTSSIDTSTVLGGDTFDKLGDSYGGGGGSNNGDNDLQSHLNWRLFAMLAALPCTISIGLGWIFVPESPRWLCTQGKCDESLDIIRKAAKMNGVDVDVVFPVGMTLQPEDVEEANFLELFAPQWRPTIFKLWGLWAAMAFGYYGIVMATTRIFASEESEGGDASVAGTSGPVTEIPSFDYSAIFVSSSAELIGITIVVALVDIAGRIPLQLVSFAVAGVCLFILCYLAANDASRKLLIAFGFLNRIFEMAASCVTWVSTAELLPTEIRTTGHSTANAVARVAAILCPFLVEDSPLIVMGAVMLAIHAFAVLCVAQLPETKGSQMGSTSGGRAADTNTSFAISEEEVVDEHRENVRFAAATLNSNDEGSSEQIII